MTLIIIIPSARRGWEMGSCVGKFPSSASRQESCCLSSAVHTPSQMAASCQLPPAGLRRDHLELAFDTTHGTEKTRKRSSPWQGHVFPFTIVLVLQNPSPLWCSEISWGPCAWPPHLGLLSSLPVVDACPLACPCTRLLTSRGPDLIACVPCGLLVSTLSLTRCHDVCICPGAACRVCLQPFASIEHPPVLAVFPE